jgi:branched-chain amino acid transport system permease protein
VQRDLGQVNLLPFVATGIGLGSVYAMSGVGLVLPYRAAGTLNFAFGALGAIAAHCTWTLIQIGVPVIPAWIVGIAVSTLGSYLYGRYISSRLVERDRTVRAICTLGFGLFLLGILTTIWGPGLPRRLALPTDNLFFIGLGLRISYTRIAALLVAIVAMVGVGLLLNRTRVGLAMRSLASNRTVSGVIGIRIGATDSIAWLISGVFAGLAGLLLADLVILNPVTLTFLVIPAMAAAIIGGLRSMIGAFIGGMAAGLAEALLTGVPDLAIIRSAAPYVIAIFVMAAAFRTALAARE